MSAHIDIANDLKNIGNEVIGNGQEIIKNAGEAVKDKCKGIKDKLIGFCNFLRHAGVALGTALGVVAGLVAAGVVAITLPVSLPVLGAIAGGLFLGGAIVTLIHNIRDPYIKGAKNVIIQTLKDIGSGMLGAIPTIISFIRDPKQIGKVINFLKTQAEDVRNDVNDLKNILEATGSKITKEAKGKFNNLLNELNKQFVNYQDKINKLTKEGIEKGDLNIETLFKDDKEAIQKCISGINDLLGNQPLDKNQKKALNALNKSFDVKQLDKSFQTLNESFSKNSKGADKKVDVVNIKEEIGNHKTNNSVFSDIDENEIRGGELGNSIAIEIVKEFKNSGGNLEKELKPDFGNISIIQNENTEEGAIEGNEIVNLAENNKSEKAEGLKTENKVEKLGTDNKKIKEKDINTIVDMFNNSSFLKNNYIKVQDNSKNYYFEQFAELQGLITALTQKNLTQTNLKGIFSDINQCVKKILDEKSIAYYLLNQDRDALEEIVKKTGSILLDVQGIEDNKIHKVEVETVKKGFFRWAQYAPSLSFGEAAVSLV